MNNREDKVIFLFLCSTVAASFKPCPSAQAISAASSCPMQSDELPRT